MIRPFTCVCFLLACGSGLYLYQAKHRVQTIDREIEKVIRATSELREQTRVLHAEWTLQSDPQRLQALSDQLLNLKTVTPGQFTSMADLDGRLPAVRAPDPVPPDPLTVPIAEDPQPEEPAIPLPPPRPATAVAAAAPPSHPPEHKPPPRPVIAEAQPVRPPPVIARPVMVAEQPRPISPAPSPGPAPMTGSALGMARGASLPPPRPMPVSASQWVSNAGGG
jgi:hypothetical protein